MPVSIKLTVPEAVEALNNIMELEASAQLVGPNGGRVQLPIKTEQFPIDEITVRNFVVDTAESWQAGAEPYSCFRRGSHFTFYFSSDPGKSLATRLTNFIQAGSNEYNNEGSMFLFYSNETSGQVRELDIFDALITNKIRELELASQVIDPAALAEQVLVTEHRLISQIDRINALRQSWAIPALPRHPSFTEIDTTIHKVLRPRLRKWPGLAEVAEELGFASQALKSALQQYNDQRVELNQVPIYLV